MSHSRISVIFKVPLARVPLRLKSRGGGLNLSQWVKKKTPGTPLSLGRVCLYSHLPQATNSSSKTPHSLLWGITGRGIAPPQVTDEAAFIPPVLPWKERVYSGDFYKR